MAVLNSNLKDPGKNIRIREKRFSLTLTDIQREILLGVTLGDATIRLEGKVKFEQAFVRKDYVNHLYDVFKEYVNVPPQIREITGGGANIRYSVWFQTNQHPDFKQYRFNFYKQKVDENGELVFKGTNIVYRKGIGEFAFLEKWLTPRAIAYWFMDDGGAHRNAKNNIDYVLISSHGFSEEENIILSDFLNKKYGLFTSLSYDGNHCYIRIGSKSLQIFQNLIGGYIHSCFNYKLFSTYDKNNKLKIIN